MVPACKKRFTRANDTQVDRNVWPKYDSNIRRSFETFHDGYRKFKENFKIPRPPGNESDPDEEMEKPGQEKPSCGTRSGAQEKRKAAAEAEIERRVKKKREVSGILQIDTEM